MNTLASFFIRNSKLTVVITLGIIIFGVQGLRSMNSESYPQVSFAMATVVTPYDGASAEDIETKITRPIEEEVRTISGLKDVRSISQAGLSTIFIRADIDNIVVDKVMADLQKAVDRVSDLPSDLKDKPIFTEIKSEEFPVIEIALVGGNDKRERDIIANRLKEELEDNSLIKDVRAVGYAERRFNISLDLDKLALHHIGVDEVMGKISSRNVNIPGGSLKGEKNQRLLRIEAKVKDAQSLANLVIRSNFSGQQVLLKDLAQVEDGEEETNIKARYNGEEATILIVSKKGGSDTLKLVADVDKKLEVFKKLHGDKYRFEIFHNESIKVRNKLDVLSGNAFSGLVLVVVFLLLFLPGRVGIMASLSLPIAVMATLGYMAKSDMNLNSITILALVIALGMLVDNSVVIAENYARLRSEGKNALDAATSSIQTLWLPIAGTAFTTIAAFMPMLVTKGIMGQFIRFIPIIVSVSLLISLIESFFLLPMRLVAVGGKYDQEDKKEGWFEKLQVKFDRFMNWALLRRYWMAGAMSFLIVFSFVLMVKGNRFDLFPAEQTEIYIARLEMPNGTRLEETTRVIALMSKKIKDGVGKHVEHVVGRAGTSKMAPTDPKAKDGNHVGMISIYVNEETKNTVNYQDFLEMLREYKLEGPGDLTYEAVINGPPVGNAIEASFRSNSQTELDQMLALVKEKMSQVDGVIDLKVDDVIGDDEVYIDVDYQKVDRLGLNVRTLGETIRTAVAGKIASAVVLDNKDVDLFLQFKEEDRNNLDHLSQYKLMDGQGNLVSLGQVAELRRETGKPQIKRYDYKRSKTLLGNIKEEKISSIAANAKLNDIFAELSPQYPSVSLYFGGAAESTRESMQSLFDALILSLIGIFALLVFLFRSYLRPAIIMSTIPLGLFGFSVAFFLHDRPISFMALIGIIGLGGIIVNSGIVLIAFIDELRAEGKMNLHDILVRASSLRLKAVIVTSLTTISGLLPTAYGIGGSDAMLIPMTMAMAWGLTSGTILTLVWVPCAYAILEDYTSLLGRNRFFGWFVGKGVSDGVEAPTLKPQGQV
jgi:multidrug efflux pump subunit AcrB